MNYKFDNNQPINKRINPSDYKYCEYCGTTLPRVSKSDYCERCQEILLFHEVKDFIRCNDVNEYQVADYFNLPLRVVKGWILDGRIEYKQTSTGQKTLNDTLVCESCGTPVNFGSLCPKCLKSLNRNLKGFGLQKLPREERMRFLNNEMTFYGDDK